MGILQTGTWQGQTTLGHDPQGKILGILGMGGIGRVGFPPSTDFSITYSNL